MASSTRVRRYLKDSKKRGNLAKLKYSKEFIIETYRNSDLPLAEIPDILISHQCSQPVSQMIDRTYCENSRKLVKNYKREKSVNFKIEISQTNPDETLENEIPAKSLSLSFIDDKKEIFESYVKYPEDLFNSYLVLKNPFACLINENCSKMPGFVYPLSKSFEKIWFYKDCLNRTQGPFSSIDMLNWAAAGYFTSHLMIAKEDSCQFLALSSFY